MCHPSNVIGGDSHIPNIGYYQPLVRPTPWRDSTPIHRERPPRRVVKPWRRWADTRNNATVTTGLFDAILGMDDAVRGSDEGARPGAALFIAPGPSAGSPSSRLRCPPQSELRHRLRWEVDVIDDTAPKHDRNHGWPCADTAGCAAARALASGAG